MKILEPGHVYELAFLDVPPAYNAEEGIGKIPSNVLTFVNREPGHEHTGTQTQEVLRALIDRTFHCDSCMPHELNALIIYHLRAALICHEMRALERKLEKGAYEPERVEVGSDGHFILPVLRRNDPNQAPRRDFILPIPQPRCTYRPYPNEESKNDS